MSLSGQFSNLSIAGVLTLLVLLCCSFYVAALGWELRRRWRESQLEGDWLLAQVRFLLYDKSLPREQVADYLKQLNRPLAGIFRELLKGEANLDQGDYLLTSLVSREQRQLERGLSGLGTVAVIAPFVGLFGTVVGITNTFADVASQGKAGIEVVSAGVSEALVATALGLVVAIVSVVLFNTFKSHFADEAAGWDESARLLLSQLIQPEVRLLKEALDQHPCESAQTYLDAIAPDSE